MAPGLGGPPGLFTKGGTTRAAPGPSFRGMRRRWRMTGGTGCERDRAAFEERVGARDSNSRCAGLVGRAPLSLSPTTGVGVVAYESV